MKKVLIVEDEESNLEALCDFIEINGYNVKGVNNAADARLEMLSFKPDVVILDIELQDKQDGMKLLKEFNSEFPKVKILMSSAYENFELECLNNGVAGFLKKPYGITTVVEAIKECVNG